MASRLARCCGSRLATGRARKGGGEEETPRGGGLRGVAQMKPVFEESLWNPVLRRELLSGLRSPRARWVLLLYLVVPFVVIAFAWPTNDVYYGGSRVAVQIWYTFLIGQIFLVMLLTPVFAAYSVSNEFEQKTAEFLW